MNVAGGFHRRCDALPAEAGNDRGGPAFLAGGGWLEGIRKPKSSGAAKVSRLPFVAKDSTIQVKYPKPNPKKGFWEAWDASITLFKGLP